ncbi:hypothetical protein GFK26_25170 [Variovorax paradoxus]|uniref:Uncharacterized protein n=1 Tax=Variovorax paradoxus TaxID=34073 RepID=A0A5Q0MBG9_VARPD|nr:hypothetical protein [Variovorax paradoxus]QFZ85825.1 hypothetical protein GFK26_25170 [Variovorax paradoxus]
MKSKSILFAIIFALPLLAFAKDVRLEANREFNACMKETKKDREQCNFGGCGNIAGTCYERQVNSISSATDVLVKNLKSGRCAQSVDVASNEIEALNSKLKLLAPFDGTWSGYDVQVEIALLKNTVMNALTKECRQ